MPTPTPAIRRPSRPTSAPLLKHSYITFIGHWRGQLCILIVVLIVGLIYFIIREPIERWRRRRREKSSTRAREGLLAAETERKRKEREREKIKDKDRDTSPAGVGGHGPGSAGQGKDGQSAASTALAVEGAAQGSSGGLGVGTGAGVGMGGDGNRKARRRKSSVLKVETKSPGNSASSLGLTPASAGMGKTGSTHSSNSAISGTHAGTASIASGTSTPALAPVSEDRATTSTIVAHGHDDDFSDEGGKRSTALEKGKGKAVRPSSPGGADASVESASTAKSSRLPAIHVRQPTLSLNDEDPHDVLAADGSNSHRAIGNGSVASTSSPASGFRSTRGGTSVLSDDGDEAAPSSTNSTSPEKGKGRSESDDKHTATNTASRKRDEGFSMIPDEGWLPPSALANLANPNGAGGGAADGGGGGGKKKKKKGKNTGAGANGVSSSTTSSVVAAAIAHANGLVKNGESSRMAMTLSSSSRGGGAPSSSGSVSGRSTFEGSHSCSGSGFGSGTNDSSPLSRQIPLSPLDTLADLPNSTVPGVGVGSREESTPPMTPSASGSISAMASGSGSASASASAKGSNATPAKMHSRKTSMGFRTGTVEEQIRERDELIDTLRAEVGLAKAEEAKARSELEERERERVESDRERERKEGKRKEGSAKGVQRQLADALASVSNQQERIQLLEQLIAQSGLPVPPSSAPLADHRGHDNHTSLPRRRPSNAQQPRLNRIASMPMPMPNGSSSGMGNLAVPSSPLHLHMNGHGQNGNGNGNVPYPQSPMMRGSGMAPMSPHIHGHSHNHASPFMASPHLSMGMPSPHMQFSPNAMNGNMQYNGQFTAMAHPTLHQPQMAQVMQAQMQAQMQMIQQQQQQQQQPYMTPQRGSFHHPNGSHSSVNSGHAIPASPSPYRRTSTATSTSVSASASASASGGRNHDWEHQRESSAAQSEKERERDESLGVADHPLAGPLTPGVHHTSPSPSPARYALSVDHADAEGVFSGMQADAQHNMRDQDTDGSAHMLAPISNGYGHGHVHGMFPSMQNGMDVGALGYADTGIGRPPGEERVVEGQRRASVESSVLKRKPVEALTSANHVDEAGAEVEKGKQEKVGMEGVEEVVVLDESDDGAGRCQSGADDAPASRDEGAGEQEVLAQDSAAPEEQGSNGRSGPNSPPSSGPTSPRSRQLLVTPGSAVLEVGEHDHDPEHGNDHEHEHDGLRQDKADHQVHVIGQGDAGTDGEYTSIDVASPMQSPSPSPMSRPNGVSMQIQQSMQMQPPSHISPMLYPAHNGGQGHMIGYRPSPQPYQPYSGQASPMPISMPLPLNPNSGFPFGAAPAQLQTGMNGHGNGTMANGTENGIGKYAASHFENHPDHNSHVHQPQPQLQPQPSRPQSAVTTPLKLPDYTPTFASLAHTPEQLLEIKRMNEEAVRRAVEVRAVQEGQAVGS